VSSRDVVSDQVWQLIGAAAFLVQTAVAVTGGQGPGDGAAPPGGRGGDSRPVRYGSGVAAGG
jgi:hypothetical protein